MSPRIHEWLSRSFFVVALGLFALAGWSWWTDRPLAAVLVVEGPIDIGQVAVAADHAVLVPVANTGREPIRLVGVDKELC